MNEQNTTQDYLNEAEGLKPKLPTGLNVLTILTIIGCSIGLIFTVWGFFGAKTNYTEREKAMEQMTSEKVPGWMKSLMPDTVHYETIVTKSYENRLPILLLSIAALGLCFFGAIQMRKFKKQGYILYVIGQVVPYITQFLFIGSFVFSGLFFMILLGFTLLFILLYTMQRKHLIY